MRLMLMVPLMAPLTVSLTVRMMVPLIIPMMAPLMVRMMVWLMVWLLVSLWALRHRNSPLGSSIARSWSSLDSRVAPRVRFQQARVIDHEL